MSSETRTIRPYRGVDHFQGALNACKLHVGQRVVEGGSRVSLTHNEYVNEVCRVTLADDDHELHEVRARLTDGLGDLRLASSDVELVVLATSPRLKMVDVVFANRLDEMPTIPRVLEFTERPRALAAPNGGCDLRVYFCLARELPPKALHPYRKGTWLGRQEYILRSDLAGVGFFPVRLTDELRTELGLDSNTTRFAAIDDDTSVFSREVAPDAVKLYIDDGLLDRLAVAAYTPMGKQLQRQMFLDAAWAISIKTTAELASGDIAVHADVDEHTGSLVHSLVAMLGGRSGSNEAINARNDQFKILVEEPARFVANLEAKLATRHDVLEIFED